VIAQSLFNDHQVNVHPFAQSAASYNEPTRWFCRAVRAQRVDHNGDPILRWAMNNLTLKHNSNEHCMPSKGRAENKIDPAVASIMGVAAAIFPDAMPTADIVIL
jgi:phage terminase large subunit-like protein